MYWRSSRQCHTAKPMESLHAVDEPYLEYCSSVDRHRCDCIDRGSEEAEEVKPSRGWALGAGHRTGGIPRYTNLLDRLGSVLMRDHHFPNSRLPASGKVEDVADITSTERQRITAPHRVAMAEAKARLDICRPYLPPAALWDLRPARRALAREGGRVDGADSLREVRGRPGWGRSWRWMVGGSKCFRQRQCSPRRAALAIPPDNVVGGQGEPGREREARVAIECGPFSGVGRCPPRLSFPVF